MFDAVPPNLPVEPTPGNPPVQPNPPSMPSVPSAQPQPMMPQAFGQGKKEPEDIFKGLDTSSEPMAGEMMPEIVDAGPKRNWFMIIGIAVAGIIVLGGIGFGIWYLLQGTKSTETPVVMEDVSATPTQPTEIVEQPPIIPEQPITTPPQGANIPTPELPVEVVEQPLVEPTSTPEMPPIVTPVEGADTDVDGLTDVEEGLYGTDPANKDTNGNGYDDGVEVRNLYDPLKAGGSITESSQVKWFSMGGVRWLLPSRWSALQDGGNSDKMEFDTGSQAKMVLRINQNPEKLSLEEWLLPLPAGADLRSIKLKGGQPAFQSADGLTTFLDINDTIISIVYEMNGAVSYDFRAAYAMLLNSLQKSLQAK